MQGLCFSVDNFQKLYCESKNLWLVWTSCGEKNNIWLASLRLRSKCQMKQRRSPMFISVPLEGGWWDCHGFTAQDGCLTQMGWHVLHVCDHGRVWQGNRGKGKKGQNRREGIQQLVHICLRWEVESGQPGVGRKVEKPPWRTKLRCMNSYIIMHLQYLHIPLIHHCAITWVWAELSPLGYCGTLTVDSDLDFALVRRSHSVVGDAFIVLGLLPLDLCDV